MLPKTRLFWGQKVKSQSNEAKNISGMGFCTLVSAGFL